ncbi:MAG TPA: hypothetical protein VFG00_08855 [Acidothermaceae bacterium]|nr:hypothetical protein [Acidothermaceae bacterium]
MLADDELGGDAYDHAVVHLDECAQCRRDVAHQRWGKAQLAQAQPAAVLDPTLLARLLRIPDSEAVPPEAQSPRLLSKSRSRRLLGRTAPSRPLRTGQPAGRRVRPRSVAAAGFAASVVVGFSGAISGSAAVPTGVGAATSAFPAVDLRAPISAVVPRPGARTAVSVVYRRP